MEWVQFLRSGDILIPSTRRWLELGGHQDLDIEVWVRHSFTFTCCEEANARLHPLAVEDALRSSNSPRSKLDFYRNHLYMQILIHHMHAHDTEDLAKASDALQSGKVDEIVIADDETHTHGDTMRKGPVKKATTSSWSLPEGVEGVFEPSVAGTRLQGGQSVRNLYLI